MQLPKARRGRVGARAYFIRIEARFIEIPKGLFEQLKTVTEERNYTESEIQDMIHRYNMQYQHVQQGLQAANNQSPQQPGNSNSHLKSPFGN